MSKLLSCYEFGRRLIESRDLDPVYVLLWEAKLEQEYLKRWLMAYWCFYHVGTACWATEGDIGYWKRMARAAASKDYPRSSERRHFRGKLSIETVEYLHQRSLKYLFQPLIGTTWEVGALLKHIKTWHGFGDWIAFKVADMLERLNLSKVIFDTGAVFLFNSPLEGAFHLYRSERTGPITERLVGGWATERILAELGHLDTPPRYERKINVQEAETILCKWKSYLGGHYELCEDIKHCRAGLLRFSRCPLAQELIVAGRKGGLWTS